MGPFLKWRDGVAQLTPLDLRKSQLHTTALLFYNRFLVCYNMFSKLYRFVLSLFYWFICITGGESDFKRLKLSRCHLILSLCINLPSNPRESDRRMS